jgi:hypothetical protein
VTVGDPEDPVDVVWRKLPELDGLMRMEYSSPSRSTYSGPKGSTRAAKVSTVDSQFTNLFTNCGD